MALTADIQQQVFDLLARASNISFVTAEKGSGSVSMLTPGQPVKAEVLSTLAHNQVQVRVGNERFNLELPMAVRVGQTLELTFVAAEPRSTFAISRPALTAPPVSLSDASRLLSLLISSEQIVDPQLRSSLQSISTMVRRSQGETTVLANLLDEVLIYGSHRDAGTPQQSGDSLKGAGTARIPPDQARLGSFEANASQILGTIARNARFTLIEAVNLPLTPLPLRPGDEVNATVMGTLPGGRAFVQVAGTALELMLPQKVVPGEILRLTFLAAEPKPTFALARTVPDATPPQLSEAGRWLSVLEQNQGGVSRQQAFVLERLNTVLKSLPPDSPAFTAILDEAITYQTVRRVPGSGELSGAIQGALNATVYTPVTVGSGMELTDDMAKLLQAVIKGNRLALLEAQNQQAMPSGFVPGQQLKGEVVAALGGGRFMVQVAGQALEFMLPKGSSRGDHINLFFIAEEPRQTFLMARFGRPGDSRVSDTGRWLSGFLSEASGQQQTQATLGLLRTLLAGPPTDAALLGRLLEKGLRESGLFYESHLARWFGGDFPLEELFSEPQGRLSPRLALAGNHTAVSADELVRASVRTGSAEIMEAVFKKAGTSMAHEGIADQRSLPIVSEQLSTLQNGQLLFRGDLFPGRHLEWGVTEREAGRNRSGGRERNWETSITINLPHLGPVTAQLTLDSSRVAIAVHVENRGTVPVLEAGRMRLTEQLEGAGLTPTEMNINHAAA